jgi:hypothetical protein
MLLCAVVPVSVQQEAVYTLPLQHNVRPSYSQCKYASHTGTSLQLDAKFGQMP